MPSHINGIDHGLIAVGDLDAAAESWRRLGFVTTPKGRHVGKSTANYCIMFPGDYLELIGVVDTAAPPSQHDALIRARGDGLFASALAPNTAEEARNAVIAAGIEALPLRDLHRAVERPDGKADLYFKNFDMAEGATPDFRFFFCHHLTPDAMRHADWLQHPNGTTGLLGITVVSPRPAALQEAYARLFGLAQLIMTDDVLTIHLPRQRIIFATAEDAQAMYPEAELPAPAADAYGAVLSFTVADLAATRQYFDAAGVAHVPSGDAVLVPPAAASDVLLEFRGGT